jgi:putative copper resistance protein D
VLFSAYAIELILLLVIAPILLALGGPVSLAATAVPQRIGEPLMRFLRTPIGTLMSYPIVGTLLLVCVPFLIYFTPWYTLTLQHAALYQLQMVVLPLLGFVFAWSVGEMELLPETFAHGVALAIAFVELLLDALPGIVIRLSTHIIGASYYASLRLDWHRDRLADQQLGGAMWWFFGEIIDLPVLAILLIRWIRADRLEAERVDAQLDHKLVQTIQVDAGPVQQPVLMRPWWEEDASVFGIRARFYERPDRRD